MVTRRRAQKLKEIGRSETLQTATHTHTKKNRTTETSTKTANNAICVLARTLSRLHYAEHCRLIISPNMLYCSLDLIQKQPPIMRCACTQIYATENLVLLCIFINPERQRNCVWLFSYFFLFVSSFVPYLLRNRLVGRHFRARHLV